MILIIRESEKRMFVGELSDLLDGDVFKCKDGEDFGPWMMANSNAKRRPSRKHEGKLVWHVRSDYAPPWRIPEMTDEQVAEAWKNFDEATAPPSKAPVIAAFIIAFIVANGQQPAGMIYPDGTLVMGDKHTRFGQRLKRRLGTTHTHVGVVIDGYVYEQDWPRAKRTPVASYGKPNCQYDFYVPVANFTPLELSKMRTRAVAELGKPYRLKTYLFPRLRRGNNGTYCSPFAGDVLNASGRHHITDYDSWEPGRMLNKVRGSYRYVGSIKR